MKKSKKIIIAVLIILIIVACFLAVYTYLSKEEEKPKEVKVIKNIPEYGYNLKENATKPYKDSFDVLDKVLGEKEVDYKEYASLVAKLFIIDFYTLDNKESKNDIGGLDFIRDDMKDNFIEQARSTFYKYLEVKSNNRTQMLPKVSKITNTLVEDTTFMVKDLKTTTTSSRYKRNNTPVTGTTYDAYKVTISWEYEEDLGYETEAKMIMIKDDKKLYIVEMN